LSTARPRNVIASRSLLLTGSGGEAISEVNPEISSLHLKSNRRRQKRPDWHFQLPVFTSTSTRFHGHKHL